MQSVYRVNIRKVMESDDGVLMCRIAMAVNDLIASNTLFDMVETDDEVDADVKAGLSMYAIRLQIAHLSTSLDVLNESDNLARVEKYLPQLDLGSQQAFEYIRSAFFDSAGVRAMNKDRTRTFTLEVQEQIKSIRDTATFHYDREATDRALGQLVDGQRADEQCNILADGGDCLRFRLADALVDRICQHSWGMDTANAEHLPMDASNMALWCHTRCRAFIAFASELCLHFFTVCCAEL